MHLNYLPLHIILLIFLNFRVMVCWASSVLENVSIVAWKILQIFSVSSFPSSIFPSGLSFTHLSHGYTLVYFQLVKHNWSKTVGCMVHLSSFGLKVVKLLIIIAHFWPHNCQTVTFTPVYCSKILIHTESYILSPQALVTLVPSVFMHDE